MQATTGAMKGRRPVAMSSYPGPPAGVDTRVGSWSEPSAGEEHAVLAARPATREGSVHLTEPSQSLTAVPVVRGQPTQAGPRRRQTDHPPVAPSAKPLPRDLVERTCCAGMPLASSATEAVCRAGQVARRPRPWVQAFRCLSLIQAGPLSDPLASVKAHRRATSRSRSPRVPSWSPATRARFQPCISSCGP